ncbi:MAG: MBL fold metallo-hydrolase [Tissierella sp.]|uniref:MBL fold metallo-hydrolase n=1 Tax=Tissierella sp. TaxID=41274 RepID=UPI003F956A98
MKIQDEMKVVMLGTGTPNPIPERSGPSLVVIVGENSYIVDAGIGLVRRAEAANRMGVKALEASNLKRASLTHLHSDHTAGLPDLILTPWVLERDEALQIYGPKGTKNMCNHLMEAYKVDIDARMNGLEKAIPQGIVVKSNDISGEGLGYKIIYLILISKELLNFYFK